MIKFNPVQFAYALMIIGIIFTFILSKREIKKLRLLADAFTIPFVKLSNYIAPQCPNTSLRVQKLENGSIRPLPLHEQSKEMQIILKRAGYNKSVQLFNEMAQAVDNLTKAVGNNRKKCYQFFDPINNILMITHTFLTGCENPESIDTEEKLEAFTSFLTKQVDHRITLLRLISGSRSEQYRMLNTAYSAEMEKIEQQQRR